MVPWLGAAYSRACEYTCDRAGLFVVGEPEAAMRGLVVLAAGGKLAALRAISQPEAREAPVRRNPFAWPLAPVFGALGGGGSAGGAMAAIAVVAILAAIAIPNFLKYQERARRVREAGALSMEGAEPSREPLVQAGLTRQQLETPQWVTAVRQQAEASEEQAGSEGR